MQPLVPDYLDFIFLWWQDEEYGVILSRQYYDLLARFHLAKNTAKTWAEFWTMLGPEQAEYVTVFTQCDEADPEDDDKLEAITECWILDTAEFPITQCAQETFQFYGRTFPELDDAITILTEYGEAIRLYPKSKYLEVKAHMENAGHRVAEELSKFPMHIYAY